MATKFTIVVNTDNAWCVEPTEDKIDWPTVALNLHEVARRIAEGATQGKMRDVNGLLSIIWAREDGVEFLLR